MTWLIETEGDSIRFSGPQRKSLPIYHNPPSYPTPPHPLKNTTPSAIPHTKNPSQPSRFHTPPSPSQPNPTQPNPSTSLLHTHHPPKKPIHSFFSLTPPPPPPSLPVLDRGSEVGVLPVGIGDACVCVCVFVFVCLCVCLCVCVVLRCVFEWC